VGVTLGCMSNFIRANTRSPICNHIGEEAMKQSCTASFLFLFLLLPLVLLSGQSTQSISRDQSATPHRTQTPISQFPADAPRIQTQTRDAIIRNFENQVAYARTAFPMGSSGLKLQNGIITPNGQELEQLIGLRGPAVKPGDPAFISLVQIMDDHIYFEINGGPVHPKKWYQHIQVSGANGAPVQFPRNKSPKDPHGSCLDIYFDKYVPEMTAQQLREILLPVLDFNAKNKEEAYLDTVPPTVKEAILAHRVLVGMNSDMVLHAVGQPLRKVREEEDNAQYEEWIYGEPPQDVNFVRIAGDEVVRVETMKVGGEKIVRTQKEVIPTDLDKKEDPENKVEEKKE
jgi:hypothetical protein